MNGPNEIRNINRARTLQALEELRNKVITAKDQNHPKADEFAEQYRKLRNELYPAELN